MNFNPCSTTITSLDPGPFISFHWTHEQVEQPPHRWWNFYLPHLPCSHLNLSRVAMSVKRDEGNDGNIVAWLLSHGGYIWIHSGHIFYTRSPNLSPNPELSLTVLQMCSFGELGQGDAKNIGNHQPPVSESVLTAEPTRWPFPWIFQAKLDPWGTFQPFQQSKREFCWTIFLLNVYHLLTFDLILFFTHVWESKSICAEEQKNHCKEHGTCCHHNALEQDPRLAM